MVKKVLGNIGAFCLTMAVCAASLFLVCLIPQSALKDGCVSSLAYFENNAKYPTVIEGYDQTIIDNYADCILLNVVYNVDAAQPLYSAVAAPYQRSETHSAAEDFRLAVVDGEAPNSEYSRYWHGSQVLLRPLLTVTDITGARWTAFGLLVLLNALLGVLLIRNKQGKAAAVYFASLLLVGGWMTAFSLEYVMSFIVMTAACIAVCRVMVSPPDSPDIKERRLTRIFTVSGTVTCFLDFLTTETLAFTVPFILLTLLTVSAKGEKEFSFKDAALRLIRFGLSWLLAYAAMFAVKWGLVYLIAGKDAFMNALTSAAYRFDGAAGMTADGTELAMGFGQNLLIALVRNLSCLIPVAGELSVGAVLAVSAAVPSVLAAVFYLFRRNRVDWCFVGVLLLIACLPYLRYGVLANHSIMHYFFTYRAQMATVMAFIAILAYQLKPSDVLKTTRPPKRRK